MPHPPFAFTGSARALWARGQAFSSTTKCMTSRSRGQQMLSVCRPARLISFELEVGLSPLWPPSSSLIAPTVLSGLSSVLPEALRSSLPSFRCQSNIISSFCLKQRYCRSIVLSRQLTQTYTWVWTWKLPSIPFEYIISSSQRHCATRKTSHQSVDTPHRADGDLHLMHSHSSFCISHPCFHQFNNV